MSSNLCIQNTHEPSIDKDRVDESNKVGEDEVGIL